MPINVVGFGALVSYVTKLADRTLDKYDVDTLYGYVELAEGQTEAKYVSLDYLFDSIKDGRKIDAIKAHRALTGMGLKESKDAIESLLVNWRYQNPA